MLKVALCGACGYMGNVVASVIDKRTDVIVTVGIDKNVSKNSAFPVYDSFDGIGAASEIDVVIDFSHPSGTKDVLQFVTDRGIPLILCTTGLSDKQQELVSEAAKIVPVFRSANMSIGINLIMELAKKAACSLGSAFDIEIVEKHHNRKIDAPSGTALMLADYISDSRDTNYKYNYDRHNQRKQRDKNEIGIHSVRGGTIVGEHEVIFAGHDEVITIAHSASSKEVFAEGAVSAALFIKDKPPGIYNMTSLIGEALV